MKCLRNPGDVYIGIDNGVSGTIGVIYGCNQYDCIKTPVKLEQDYHKTTQNVSRIDRWAFTAFLYKYLHRCNNCYAVMERPMINPRFFKATYSASRSVEATLIYIESFATISGLRYKWLDSKEWQKAMLPKGTMAKELKLRSMQIASRSYPNCSELFMKHKDGDGMLMAEYCRKSVLSGNF